MTLPQIACSSPFEDVEEASYLVSHNIVIGNRRTSIRVEPELWDALVNVCKREGMSVCELVTIIDGYKRRGMSRTSAIRVFVLSYFCAAATESGHKKAGHNLKSYSIPAHLTMMIGSRPPRDKE